MILRVENISWAKSNQKYDLKKINIRTGIFNIVEDILLQYFYIVYTLFTKRDKAKTARKKNR